MPDGPPPPASSATAPYDEAAIARARTLLNALPESVGPYRILERLGGGGMGEVYRAEQRTPIRREVALKLIKLGMDTKLVIARFEAERQALALMDHPHIAKVFDAGADETGRPFFVMEYVRGKPITEYADQNHLTIAERLELFEQVCQAIQHAHHKGVIHRDLKPGNVLVSTHDAKAFSKVIDFGIAKAIAQRLTDETLFTAHDQFLGTPQYMSPEQAEGSVDIDTRTDVYSLGVLLYELLTGSTPFTSVELRAAAFEQLKKQIIEVDPPKPSTRLSLNQPTLSTLAASRRTEPKRLGALVRGELDWIVMKALEKDRKRRYETPTSLASDIMAHLKEEPVQAAPPSAAYRLQKFVRKHRAAILGAGAVGGALLVGGIGTTWSYVRAERTAKLERIAREEADTQHNAAELEAYVANIALAQTAIANASWPEARSRLDACPESHRGWEWHFLQQQARPILAELPIQMGDADFSPDGTRVLTIGKDKTARVWDLSGKVIGRPMRHDEGVSSAVFCAGGSRIVTISGNQEEGGHAPGGLPPSKRRTMMRVWDENGHPLGEPIRFESNVATPIVSPDGSCFLTICDLTARLWDSAGRPLGKPLRPGFSGDAAHRALSATFSSDGTRILSVSMFQYLEGTRITGQFMAGQFWDLAGDPAGEPIRFEPGVTSATFSPDGSSILTIYRERAVWLWDTKRAANVALLLHDRPIIQAEFSTDGTRIVTKTSDGAVRVWDLAGNQIRPPIHDKTEVTWFTAASREGSPFLISNEKEASLWNSTGILGRVYLPGALANNNYNYPTHEISADGKRFLIAYNGSVGRTAIVDSQQMGLAVEHLPSARISLEIAADLADQADSGGTVKEPAVDARWSATIDEERRLRVIDRQTGKGVLKFENYRAPVNAYVFSPDGTRLVTGDDRTVWFHDTATWRELAAIRQEEAVKELAFTPDGARLMVHFADGNGQIWDIRPQALQQQSWARHHAALKPARAYVRGLLAGPVKTADLERVVSDDKTLFAWHKIVALDVLGHEISLMEDDAASRFDEARASLFFKEDRLRLAGREPDDAARIARVNQAVRTYIDNCSPTPADGFPEGAIGNVVEQAKRTAEELATALDTAQQAINLEPKNAGLWHALGVAQYQAGEFQRAIDSCARSEGLLANNGHCPLNTIRIAMAKFRLGDVVAARSLLEKERQSSYDSKYVWESGEQLYFKVVWEFFVDEAARELNAKAWALVARPNLAPVEYAAGRDAALGAVSLMPLDVDALTTLGVANYRVGEFQQALDACSKSEELPLKGERYPTNLIVCAMARLRQGDAAAAGVSLAQAKQRMLDNKLAMSEDDQGLLKEAEALIDAPPAREPSR